MNQVITELLRKSAEKAGIPEPVVNLEHPEDISYGDFSSNMAMVHAKSLKTAPKVLAEKILEEFKKVQPKEVESVEVAGPGFINIKLKDSFFSKEILEISKQAEDFGKNLMDKNEKIIVEYTQPNPFKEFHIGHLMNNAIGESISRVLEMSGGEVKRVTYHGDVGLHIAKAVWYIKKTTQNDITELNAVIWNPESAIGQGQAYSAGDIAYNTDESAKKEIIEVNKKIYNLDKNKNYAEFSVEGWYQRGKKKSLEYFKVLFDRLGSVFDGNFYESDSGDVGKELVLKFLKKGIFEKGDGGAIVFKGENFEPKTHTRVFLNSEGLPTYEAKELGLAEMKKNFYDFDFSITITANEQDSFFNVVEVAIKEIRPELKDKILHLSHGILKLSTGKMSSRTGNIISAEDLINQTKQKIIEKIAERDLDNNEKDNIAEKVSIAAIKYSILRQAIGGDIIFDFEKSLSFEGDSGPYLQYAYVRANAVIKKAEETGISFKDESLSQKVELPGKVELLEKLLIRFPEIIERARTEYAPHHIVTYLIELASSFNSYYAQNKIIDEKDPLSPYRLTLTKVFAQVMKNGLWILGIKVPERM